MVKIGEYQITQPKFIIFTDKDGTIDLEDKQYFPFNYNDGWNDNTYNRKDNRRY